MSSSQELPTIEQLEQVIKHHGETILSLVHGFDTLRQAMTKLQNELTGFRNETREQHTILVDLITSRLPPPPISE